MTHPNVEMYLKAFGSDSIPDASAVADMVADDVKWHEAGSEDVLQGRDAVVSRMTAIDSVDASIDLRAVLGDDEHLVAVGHADFGEIEYDYVEYYTLRDGQVTERWSYMDAVPEDVAKFFAALG